MRAFLALDLPKEAISEIIRISNIIKSAGLIKAKFTPPENLHLTLKFFGEIIPKESSMIYNAIKPFPNPKIQCTLEKLGFFENKIFWLNLQDNGEIKKLHDFINKRLGDFFDTDERFHNHITIARIKSIQDQKKLQALISSITIKPIICNFLEYKLKSSQLTPKGPIYQDEWSIRLD